MNNPRRLASRPLLVVTALLALYSRPLAAETVNCTAIGALPAVISSPGAYCLTSNQLTNLASGDAIAIEASDVALDLNGFTIDNSAAGPTTTADGVFAANRRNVTIRNGVLRGFGHGVGLVGSLPNSPIL